MQRFTQQKRQASTPDRARRTAERRRIMKHCTYGVRLALTVLSVLVLAVPGRAQQTSQLPANLVPLKFTYLSVVDRITIPVNPPIQPTRIAITGGQSDLLGPFTGIAHSITHLGADGNLAYVDGGVGVLTAANGNAVFFTYAGLLRPPTTPGVLDLEDHLTITGGTGRFASATGSGVLNVVIDFSKPQAVGTFEGMITAPKP